MTAPSLADWLLSCVAADEEVARAAVAGPWRAVEGSSGEWWVELPSTADIAIDLHGENARHIATHDPARVLANCAALRAVVALCAEQSDPDVRDLATGILRALAAPFAGRAGWREEWA